MKIDMAISKRKRIDILTKLGTCADRFDFVFEGNVTSRSRQMAPQWHCSTTLLTESETSCILYLP